jgi:hypothetical protein
MTRQQILQNPAMRAQIAASNPLMDRVLESSEQFRQLFLQMQRMSGGAGLARGGAPVCVFLSPFFLYLASCNSFKSDNNSG